jgi:outer membrane usher protein FimD/PapC
MIRMRINHIRYPSPKTEGTSSTVSVTKQSNIIVSANVNIGDFGINASGTVSQD